MKRFLGKKPSKKNNFYSWEGYGYNGWGQNYNYRNDTGYYDPYGYRPKGNFEDYDPYADDDDVDGDDSEHEGFFPREEEAKNDRFLDELHTHGYKRYRDMYGLGKEGAPRMVSSKK